MYLSDGQCLSPSQTQIQACSHIQQSSFGLFFSAVRLCQPNGIKEQISHASMFVIQIKAQSDPERQRMLAVGLSFPFAQTIFREIYIFLLQEAKVSKFMSVTSIH